MNIEAVAVIGQPDSLGWAAASDGRCAIVGMVGGKRLVIEMTQAEAQDFGCGGIVCASTARGYEVASAQPKVQGHR